MSTTALSALVAASRPAPRAPPTLPVSYSPTSLSALLSRIATFRLATYSPKPAALSPPACARVGWTNDRTQRERVVCVTCSRGLIVTPPTHVDGGWTSPLGRSLEREYAHQLERDAHDDACPWRMRGCARGLYRCRVEGRGKLAEELVDSARGSLRRTPAVADVRLRHPLSDDELAKVLEAAQDHCLVKAPVATDAATEAPPSASLVLALFGWTAAAASSPSSPVLTCTLCTREVLITAYLPDSSPATTALPTFDVVSQHQAFCPFVDTLPTPTASPPSASPLETAIPRRRTGWQLRLDTLAARPRRASAVVAAGGHFSWPSDVRPGADPKKVSVRLFAYLT